jgi:hypothetical protein
MDDLREHMREATGHTNLGFQTDGVRKGDTAFSEVQDLDRIPVRIRPAESNDAHMIIDSWLKSYAAQNKDQPSWALYPMQKTVIRRLLKDGVTLVAAGNTHESQNDIYAWMCAQRSPSGIFILHYSFTKMIFRKRGLFTALLGGYDHKRGENIFCSHRGWLMKEIKDRYSMRYVPQLQFDWGMDQFERAYHEVRNRKKGKK